MAGCQDCTAFLNTYRGVVRASRTLRGADMPAEQKRRLLTFLRPRRLKPS